MEIVRQQSGEKVAILSLKPWSNVVKLPIHRAWTISNDLMFQQKRGPYAESLKRTFPGVSTFSKTESVVLYFWVGKMKALEVLPKPLKDSYKQTNKQTERMNTVEFRFFEPPREMKFGLKSWKFQNSKACYKITPIYHLGLHWRLDYSQCHKLWDFIFP